MSDSPNRPIEFLVGAKVDDASFNHAIERIDALNDSINDLTLWMAKQAGQADRVGDAISQSADKSQSSLSRLSGAIGDAASDFNDFGGAAIRQFTNLLGVIAKVAAAVGGLAVGSSLAFASRFAGVDPQANAQNAAQNRVKVAFEDLGRVMSRLVTPALESLAKTIEVVALFLDKAFPQGSDNPITYFLNTTIPTFAKSLIDLSGIAQVLGATLKFFAEDTLDSLATGFRIVFLQVQKGFEDFNTGLVNAIDDISTTFEVFGLALQDTFGKIFNGLLEAVAGLAIQLGQRDLAGSLLSSIDAKALNTGADDRSNYQRQQDALLANNTNSRATGRGAFFESEIAREQTNKTSRAAAANDAYLKTVGEIATQTDTAKKNFDALGKALTDTANASLNAQRIGRQEVEAFIQRNENRAKADKQYAADQKAVDDEKTRNLTKAEKDRDKSLADLNKEQTKREQELRTKAGKDRQKSQIEFSANENRILEQADLKRQQDIIRNQLKLDELAASGDVAGFVQEDARQQLEMEAENETAALESRQRQEQQVGRLAEIDSQLKDELAQLKSSGEERRGEILTQYAEQTAAVKDAARDQLAALKTKHAAELIEIDTAFAKQVAALESNLGGLNELQNAYYFEQTGKLKDFVDQNGAYLQQLYNMRPGAGGTYSPATIGGLSASQMPQGNLARASVIFQAGAIQNTVGDLVTGSALGNALQTIVGSLGEALNVPAANAARNPVRHVSGGGA